jgi:hypothetical protein
MLAICLGIWSLTATAAEFDGSKPLICATIETFECVPGGECLEGTPESIDAPQFIRLDFAEKVARATRPDGEERTSGIEILKQDEGELILQGVQGGLGWSMAITPDSGKMALSASGDGVVFALFGACAAL